MPLPVYVLSSLGIFGISATAALISRRFGALEYYMDMPYCYNYFLTLIASVSLFYVFKQMEVREGKVVRTICRVAPYTFGVYLLHENMAVRDLWPKWLGAEGVRGSLLFVPQMLFAVVVVFVFGIVVDFFRKKVFELVMRK